MSEAEPVEISEILERKGSKKGQTQKRWVFPTLLRMNSGTHCCKAEEDQLGYMDSFDDLKMHTCKSVKNLACRFYKTFTILQQGPFADSKLSIPVLQEDQAEYGYLWKIWKSDSIYVYNFYDIK